LLGRLAAEPGLAVVTDRDGFCFIEDGKDGP